MGNDKSRELILARRARFVAAALASVASTTVGLAVSGAGCGGDVVESDAGKPEASDGRPQVCLSPPRDPLPGDAGDAGGDADARPVPCLDVSLPDGG